VTNKLVDDGLPLLAVLRSYPGGLPALVRDSKVPRTTVYMFARAQWGREPVETAIAIARAFRGKPDPLELGPLTARALLRRWRAERRRNTGATADGHAGPGRTAEAGGGRSLSKRTGP
jgi:hypothetical protein